MSAGTGPVEDAACAVLIVGAGPTGLLLAALLARRGVDVRVLERRAAPPVHSRAIGLHPPALRALAEIGSAREAVALGERVRIGRARARGRALGGVDFARGRALAPFVLTLPQSRTEDLLVQRLAALAPSALQRGWEVTDLQEAAGAVTVTARRSGADPGLLRLRADLVVGADGSRSRVRSLLGIPADGRDPSDMYLMGDLADPAGAEDEREAHIHLESGGVVESFPLPGGQRRWVVHTGTVGRDPTAALLVALVRERTGTVLDPATATMISAFAVRRRAARRLLSRRCVLLGDAAHEISPIGGQGITLGWLDALDLAPLIEHALALRRPPALREDPAWRRVERRIRRRTRCAGALATLNTVLGRPAPGPLSELRALTVRLVLGTSLRDRMAWVYSMGWAARSMRRDSRGGGLRRHVRRAGGAEGLWGRIGWR
ncbi:NAD(P)/FAD-dependent oxidoreductase [Brachybacterium sp.]|uniref:FAD-dependent oxidoreductase n=1 Tax=Brachybacterium sp. TaxID=1891286 RepID=UPI002ED4F406